MTVEIKRSLTLPIKVVISIPMKKKESHQVRLSHQGQDIVFIFIKRHRINLPIKFGKLVQEYYCCQTEYYS